MPSDCRVEDLKHGNDSVVDIPGSPPDLGDDQDSHFMFDPPLYIQRYMKVSEIITAACSDESWTVKNSPTTSSPVNISPANSSVKNSSANISSVKNCSSASLSLRNSLDGCHVVDLGCAEMVFFRYLKQIAAVTAVSLVDVCADVLRRCACRVAPSPGDSLQQRVRPLHVQVLCGSVADCDTRLAGCDVVSAIELIEHLHEPELAALPDTIFGFIQPHLAVITTPNREFNTVFKMDATDMRHWDHKFEWTRAQFGAWCRDVVARYRDYDVTFSGVGVAPAENGDVGFCTQMAVFRRRSPTSVSGPVSATVGMMGSRPYELVYDTVYKHRCAETLLLGSVDFWTRQIAYGRRQCQLAGESSGGEEEEEGHVTEYSLIELSCLVSIPSIGKLCGSVDRLATILREHDRSVVECDGVQYVRFQFNDETDDWTDSDV